MFAGMPIKAVHATEMVYISEVAWAGSSLSSADEWIELANPSDMQVDISGWVLKGAGSSDADIIFPQATYIPPNGALLVANYDVGHPNAAHTVAPHLVTSTISLSNSKMLIRLFDSDGVLVDQAGDGGAPFGGFSSDTKASMIRADHELLGDSEEVWMTCEFAENLITTDCGTPGLVDFFYTETTIGEPDQDDGSLPQAGEESTSVEDAVVVTAGEELEKSAETPGAVTSTEVVDFSTSTVPESTATSTETMAGTADSMPEATMTAVITSTEAVVDTEAGNTPLAPTSTVMSEAQNQLPRTSFQQETITRFLRMNEVMAAPKEGKEWVELVNLAADRTIVLDGLEIHDSTSRAVKLSGELKPQEKYKVFEISSSKLNNSGDSVYLQTSDGIVIDSLTYAGHERGTLLARDEKQKWQYTKFPTPGGVNVIGMDDVSTDDQGLKKNEESQTFDKVVFAAVTSTLEAKSLKTANESGFDDSETIASSTTQSFGDQMMLRINEIMPNPNEGKEWVELISYSTSSVSLEGLELLDAAGKLMSLKGELASGAIIVIELGSARLNNGGDSLILATADGETIDRLDYSGSQKGFSFARQADGSWKEALPTKGNANFDESETLSTSVDSDKTTPPPAVRQSSVISKSPTFTKKTSTSSSSSKSKLLFLINDFSMLHQEQFGGMRVKLRGTVGTMPGQVSGRAFILLNHEGRGLLVKVPSYKKIPAYGTFLTITGNLKFNSHELPYLSLTQKDGWIVEKQLLVEPKTRNVNFLAPQAEAAWGLVTAEGIVNDVSGATVHMIVNDVDVDFKIKSGVAYRASRIKKGDTIKVTGILDITNDIAVIIPRSEKEIEILSNAQENLANTSNQSGGMPGWTPFGAAAIAVGAVEGLKQAKKRIKKETVRSVFNKVLAG